MSADFNEIKIVGIDENGIVKDDSFLYAYRLPFILSSRPDDTWVRLFEYAYYSRSPLGRRKAFVLVDRIVVIMAKDESIGDHRHNLETAVKKANGNYITMLRKEEHQKKLDEERREQELKEQEDTIKKLKEGGKKLKF
jgi:hypothetical protein